MAVSEYILSAIDIRNEKKMVWQMPVGSVTMDIIVHFTMKESEMLVDNSYPSVVGPVYIFYAEWNSI